MRAALERRVWRRAKSICEYCRMPQSFDSLPFHVDHIIALKHNGPTDAANLALACYNCNLFKGPNIAGIDPDTGDITRLFHPRKDLWPAHFVWNGAVLEGLSPVARTTLAVLAINAAHRVAHRNALIADGVFPAEL
ncbi:MAG: HNH endonuclease signature motif containing protein [Pirellulales bacterium]